MGWKKLTVDDDFPSLRAASERAAVPAQRARDWQNQKLLEIRRWSQEIGSDEQINEELAEKTTGKTRAKADR